MKDYVIANKIRKRSQKNDKIQKQKLDEIIKKNTEHTDNVQKKLHLINLQHKKDKRAQSQAILLKEKQQNEI